MGQAIMRALVESQTLDPQNVFATNRSAGKLLKVQESYGVQPLNTNEELVDACDVVFLCVKPQDLVEVIEPIASSFQEHHVVLSLAAGFSLKSLRKLLPDVKGLARVMPNTPASIRRAVVGYCLAPGAEAYQGVVEDLLQPIGQVVPTSEGESFEALTVSCGSGTGFVLELMQYWQEWIEEHGFDSPTARKMVIETFLGAALMAEQVPQMRFSELQDRVISKKGVTAAGLQSMRELEIERALRYSFEKAVLRDQELSQTTSKM
jgi:pyrroline-5-carboxylate reductase